MFHSFDQLVCSTRMWYDQSIDNLGTETLGTGTNLGTEF